MKTNYGCSHFQLSALAVVGFLYSLQAYAVGYTITDLGNLGSAPYAYDINNNGQVAGWSQTPYSSRAFIYSSGVMNDIGGFSNNPYMGSEAYGINLAGQAVGFATIRTNNGGALRHAFVYSGGVMNDIGSLGPTDGDSVARSINNNGQVVGDSAYGYPASAAHAFLYSNGIMSDLGTLGGARSTAYDINDAGAVVGSAEVGPSGDSHAFVYSNGIMSDLGTLGGTWSEAHSINNVGDIAGTASTGVGQHAVIWRNGVMIDLGALGLNSTAVGINNNGQVVGNSNSHAFLYSDGSMMSLESLLAADSGWTLVTAAGINDKGQIVGIGSNGDGAQHAYLLTPVPLPVAFWLFGSGLIGMLGFMRHRKS